MRWEPLVLCAVCVLGHLVISIPVPETDPESFQGQQSQLPLDVQERLRSLQLAEPAYEQVTRDKRTIAVLRQLFPGLSQLIDRQIQRITQYLFRVIGRLVLRGGLGGGMRGGSGSNNRTVTITLPTFPPDTEDEEDAEDEEITGTTEEGATTEASTDAASVL